METGRTGPGGRKIRYVVDAKKTGLSIKKGGDNRFTGKAASDIAGGDLMV